MGHFCSNLKWMLFDRDVFELFAYLYIQIWLVMYIWEATSWAIGNVQYNEIL